MQEFKNYIEEFLEHFSKNNHIMEYFTEPFQYTVEVDVLDNVFIAKVNLKFGYQIPRNSLDRVNIRRILIKIRKEIIFFYEENILKFGNNSKLVVDFNIENLNK